MTPRAPQRPWHWAWCGGALVLLAVPNLVAVVTPLERWPLTSAPMFAASPIENARYRTHFIVEERGVDGAVVDVDFPVRACTGLSEWRFRRSFLVEAWGSDDDDAPFGYVDGDTDAARAARVGRYLGGIVRFARAQKKPQLRRARALRVEIEQVHPPLPPAARRRVLGRYVVDDDRFVYVDGARQ